MQRVLSLSLSLSLSFPRLIKGEMHVSARGRGKWRVELVDSHHFKRARIKGRARAFTRSDSHPYRGGATNRSVVRNFPVRDIDPPSSRRIFR